MTRYAAFLRGINVGGHKKIKMADLRRAFASWGFQDTKTVLASGNVAFSFDETQCDALVSYIEDKIERTFGFDVQVAVRTMVSIRDLVTASPFRDIDVTPRTRLYVTFLSPDSPRGLKAPYESLNLDFQVLEVSAHEVYSVLTLSSGGGTIKSMEVLEKAFGKRITTRNWNTIVKLANL